MNSLGNFQQLINLIIIRNHFNYSVSKKRFGESTVIHKHGNIHRLKDNADSDDDTNTWNGNSTQQM